MKFKIRKKLLSHAHYGIILNDKSVWAYLIQV